MENPTRDIARRIIAEFDNFQQNFTPTGGALTFYSQLQLQNEPFIGFASTKTKSGKVEYLLISRHSVPFGLRPTQSDTDFASYLSPRGRIVAKLPGDTFHVHAIDAATLQLLAKSEFRPKKPDGRWDATDAQILFGKERLLLRSLRNFLKGPEVPPEEGRRIQYEVQLPDQAILDAIQDEIFRLPFNSSIRISGAPGTGKTTVLLKRLSQKTKKEFLSEDELKVLHQVEWNEGRNWMLFTPSDLLKVYLKEAMAKELLPASDEHVKVYRTFRLETLRDIGVIRVGNQGFFRAGQALSLMKRSTGKEQALLSKAFGDYLAETYATLFKEALQQYNNQTREPLGKLTDANQRVLTVALETFTKAAGDPVATQRAQARAADLQQLNQEITTVITRLRGIGALQQSRDTYPLQAIYAESLRLHSTASTISSRDIDAAVFPEIPALIRELRAAADRLVDAIALSKLFQSIPKAYQDFRDDPEVQKRYFLEDSSKHIKDRLLTESEMDVVLFHSLEFVRQIHADIPSDFNRVPNEVRYLMSQLRVIVAVDEAADFSPMEVACMERFSIPHKGGVTICGDLMQRVTEQGLKKWEDLSDICSDYKGCDLSTSYRQTEKLFSIAKDLYRSSTGTEPDFRSAYPSREQDPPAVRFKPTDEVPVQEWLKDRICEIFNICERHLPTTAILVSSTEEIEPLAALLKPLLLENGIELETSNGGGNLGNSSRVRLFPVESIKGLEFEAVFYVGLDRMAEIHKELIDKYVYVGLSRARSFLGVTYDRQFPQRLKTIADHFVENGTWEAPS